MGYEAKDILEKAVERHWKDLLEKMEAKKTEQRMMLFAKVFHDYDRTLTKKRKNL